MITRIVVAVVLFIAAWFGFAEARRAEAAADAHERIVTFRADAATPDDELAALMPRANAAYRATQRQTTPVDSATLDLVLQGYATVLRARGFDRDAAYNYEYVARLRDRLARERKPRPAPAKPQPPARATGDLPLGPTIHGVPGRHPDDPKGEEFEILTPMEFGEREAQPEQTPGRKLPRKG